MSESCTYLGVPPRARRASLLLKRGSKSVDARLAKRFDAGGASVEVSASVFNLLGSQFEAEEQIVWQADYRRITMVRPPRASVIGVRIER